MNTKAPFAAIAFGLLAASFGAHAATAPEQIQAVQPGQTRAQVEQALGQPESAPVWLNGTQSLVYQLADASDPTARAYINIGPDNTVRTVESSDDGGDN